MPRPPGLKIYRGLLNRSEVEEILSHEEYKPPRLELFRYFGEFGSKDVPKASPWMLAWGEKLHQWGLFEEIPNQYRVCDWVGELSAQFKWHIDNHRHGENILAICLSDGRAIGFRPNSDKRAVYELSLDAGDAYLIAGAARWSWEHTVLPRGKQKSGGKSFVVSYKRP